MKFTTEDILDLLQSIGLQDADLVDAESDYNRDEALKAIDASRMTIIEPRLQKKQYDDAKAKVTAIMHDETRRLVKRLAGVDNEKLKELHRWEDVVAAGMDHVKGLTSRDKEDLQKEIYQLLEKHNEALEAERQRYSELDNQWQNKWTDREITACLASALNEAPILETADRNVIATDFKNYLQTRYSLGYDEAAKTVSIYMKDSPDMPVLNETGTARIQLMDEARAFLTPRGLWQKDMRHKQPDPNIGNDYKPASRHTMPEDGDPLESFNKAREKFFEDVQ